MILCMRVTFILTLCLVENGRAFRGFIFEHDRATGAKSSLAPRPSCGCMRTCTLTNAWNLPSYDRSQACCVAGKQVFVDNLSLRPASWVNLRTAEIVLIKTILIYEPEVRASARGTLRTIPGVDSQLLAPPARPQGERRPLTWLPLHDADAWPSCAVDSALCSSI